MIKLTMIELVSILAVKQRAFVENFFKLFL